MNIIINAVFPTLVLLALGNIVRRKNILDKDFWSGVDKLTYFILFPALLIAKISQVDLTLINLSQILIFIGIYFSAISFLAFAIFKFTGTHSNQFSSVYQSCLRFNTYIYFAIIAPAWGQDALAIAALFAGIVIPFTNICSVSSFAFGEQKVSFVRTLKSIAYNPLIIATLVGFTINIFPLLMPQVVFNSLNILASAALPLALLSVGASIQIRMLFKKQDNFPRSSMWLSTIGRLLIAPTIAALIVNILGIDTMLGNIIIIYAAVPTATASYILSKQLGGNSEMMATMLSFQTVLSMLTLTAWLLILT